MKISISPCIVNFYDIALAIVYGMKFAVIIDTKRTEKITNIECNNLS